MSERAPQMDHLLLHAISRAFDEATDDDDSWDACTITEAVWEMLTRAGYVETCGQCGQSRSVDWLECPHCPEEESDDSGDEYGPGVGW